MADNQLPNDLGKSPRQRPRSRPRIRAKTKEKVGEISRITVGDFSLVTMIWESIREKWVGIEVFASMDGVENQLVKLSVPSNATRLQ